MGLVALVAVVAMLRFWKPKGSQEARERLAIALEEEHIEPVTGTAPVATAVSTEKLTVGRTVMAFLPYLVVIVVFLFLGSVRATIIPLIAVPVSLIGTFAVFGPGTGFFDDEMVALLQEIANSAAYAFSKIAAGDALQARERDLQLAQSGDRIDSAVVPLPDDRRKVNLGRLVIKSVAADATGECLTITYNPIVLPKGVEPSSDPMLAARAAPYVVGLGRRLGEGAKQ